MSTTKWDDACFAMDNDMTCNCGAKARFEHRPGRHSVRIVCDCGRASLWNIDRAAAFRQWTRKLKAERPAVKMMSSIIRRQNELEPMVDGVPECNRYQHLESHEDYRVVRTVDLDPVVCRLWTWGHMTELTREQALLLADELRRAVEE